jgi:hypothetical protein
VCMCVCAGVGRGSAKGVLAGRLLHCNYTARVCVCVCVCVCVRVGRGSAE